jgi:hypothetical protein
MSDDHAEQSVPITTQSSGLAELTHAQAEEPAPDRLGSVERLQQELVDFLHRLFPAHDAPGKPSTTPVVPQGAPSREA